jgi:hypothetical protein
MQSLSLVDLRAASSFLMSWKEQLMSMPLLWWNLPFAASGRTPPPPPPPHGKIECYMDINERNVCEKSPKPYGEAML